MRSREVVGRKIVKVEQQRFWNEHIGEFAYSLDSITLDNGTVIVLIASETDYEPYVHAFTMRGRD